MLGSEVRPSRPVRAGLSGTGQCTLGRKAIFHAMASRLTVPLILLVTLAAVACHRAPTHGHTGSSHVPLRPLERRVAGCYRVEGISPADSSDIGFRPDSVLRMQTTIVGTRGLPLGVRPPRYEYVNRHTFVPRPLNFETFWWVEQDTLVRLEWRTPPSPPGAVAHIYGGGAALLRVRGDTLVGLTMAYRDYGPAERGRRAVRLVRLAQCL